MSAAYLIDGYNLLHAMGILRGRVGPHGLEKARQRLLTLLCSAHGEEAGRVTVVFDAGGGRPGSRGEEEFRGLRVCFAVGYDEADDLIEHLIRQAAAPRQLHVISDDHRIRRAARRRHCQVVSCPDYLDALDRLRRPPPRQAAEPPDKAVPLSAGDTQKWLAEFADLADDPDLKTLLGPFDFEQA
jgi:predicted RNA-binding protein with PIN domain